MLLSHLARLCVLLPSITSALAQNPNPSPSASPPLPTSLQSGVPACAQSCLRTALFTQFPVACTSPIDLKCLCSRYSVSGSALGEVALACTYASCPIVDGQAASAYNICVGQEGAVTQTQTAVTVTVVSSTTSLPSQSSTPVTASTSSASVPTTLESVGADSVTSTSTLISSQPTASTIALPVASPPIMKPAQIAGLAVAVVAAFILATGLMALSIFIRKRRERKEMMRFDEEKRAAFPPDRSPSLGSPNLGSPGFGPPQTPPKQFPLHQPRGQGRLRKYSASITKRNGPESTITGFSSLPNRKRRESPSTRHAAARQSRDSIVSIPMEQIGMAVSAEESARPTRPSAPGPRRPPPAETRQDRRQTLRFTLEALGRPDSAVSQDTVFEEDDRPWRRRHSSLLPSPPVAIPPLRKLQPPRPVAQARPVAIQQEVPAVRVQPVQQASLSLAIPVRHSRSLAEVAPPRPEARPAVVRLAPTIHISAASTPTPTPTPQATSATSAASSGYIPDYYFSEQSPMPPLSAPHYAQRTPQESPQVSSVKPKRSASTVSRATSRASTHNRDSISSQTSFESVDSNDPTPEDDDEDKQLSDAAQLSPVAESPISSLRYPKIPRTSNQRVPRSPRSPRSPGSPQHQATSKRPVEPSALLVKRRGEKEALKLENALRMDSVRRPDGRHRTRNLPQLARAASVQNKNPGPSSNNSTQARGRQARVQSGQGLQSPFMYDGEAVRPPEQQTTAPKSPAWVPNLTPKRHGDDLFLDVSYTKPAT